MLAAMGVGVNGLLMDLHPDPESALDDGPNIVPLHRPRALPVQRLAIRIAVSEGAAVSPLCVTGDGSGAKDEKLERSAFC